MIKVIYLALILVVLLPGVVIAAQCVLAPSATKQLEQAHLVPPGSSANVISVQTTFGWGQFALLEIYRHFWAAILFLAGFIACIVGLVFLFFVRTF